MLHDPSAKARAAAAAALTLMVQDRRTRAFMAIAGGDPARVGARNRAFTPLSASLSAMLSVLHSALGGAVGSEAAAEVQLELLKAARVVIAHSPYARLPPGCLQAVTDAVLSAWQGFQQRVASPQVRFARKGLQHKTFDLGTLTQLRFTLTPPPLATRLETADT